MRLRGLGRVKRWYLKSRSFVEFRVAILMYHRVTRADSDPFSLCVTPEHFAEHMEQLRSRYLVLSLKDLKNALLANSLPRRAVVVTFDDGYADNRSHAQPLLERYEVPSTFFVTTGYLQENRRFWWDELERLILRSPSLPQNLSVTVSGKTLAWDLGTWATLPVPGKTSHPDWRVGTTYPTPRHRSYYELHRLLLDSEEEERERVLAHLGSQVVRHSNESPDDRTMNLTELSDLSKSQLVEIGSHAVTHTALSALTPDRCRWELDESKRVLEDVVGKPVSAISYPFGGVEDVGELPIQLAKESGFDVGCSSIERTVTAGEKALWLPRLFVPNWDGDEFSRGLRMFFRTPQARS